MSLEKLKKILTTRELEKLVSAVKWVKNDFLRFLLLMVVILFAGSGGIALVYGCWPGIVLLVATMLFVLAALYINKKSEEET